jgi:NitT/TauT family transport system ATP-binding protein
VIQELAEFGELRWHMRELDMNEYRAQQAQVRPASFSE